MTDATRAEVCAIAIAEVFRGDGEVIVSPIGNLPQVGARLAKLSFEPGLLLTDGNAYFIANVLPLGGGGVAAVRAGVRGPDSAGDARGPRRSSLRPLRLP